MCAGVYEGEVGVEVETAGGDVPPVRHAGEEGGRIETETGTEAEGGGETAKEIVEAEAEVEEDHDRQGELIIWCALIGV